MTLGETPALRAPCVITLLRSWLTNQAIATMTATSASVRMVLWIRRTLNGFNARLRNDNDKIAWPERSGYLMEPLASSSLLEGLCLRYRGGVEREEVEVFYDELVRLVRKSWRGRDVVVGRKVFGKSLSRL